MQNTKDTFYLALRSRLAEVNPGRVINLRGIQRPGILVEENELVTAQIPTDVFVLRWTSAELDPLLPLCLLGLECEVVYCTLGSANNVSMDRGRAMTAMDAELLSMLAPSNSKKVNTSAASETTMATNIFWYTANSGALDASRGLLKRVVTVKVYGYQEKLPGGVVEL